VQIPVRAGDRIGLSSEDVELAYETSNAADRIGFFGVDVPVGGLRATDGEPFPEFKLDVAATLQSEPGAVGLPANGGAAPGTGGLPGQGQSSGAPAVTALRIAPRAFRAASSGPSIRPAGRTTRAAKVSYRVKVATTVRFAVVALRSGRRAGTGTSARCVAATARNRKAARCTRELPIRGSFTQKAVAGANSLRFTGRIAGRKLKAGAYRLVVRPAAIGAPAEPAKRSFRIVR
jgi:hypothetical protein